MADSRKNKNRCSFCGRTEDEVGFLISLGGATVADIAIHPRYEKSDFIFGATAKTASIFILS